MLFRDLATHVKGRMIGDGNVEITSIEYDSRAVRPGSVFVAVPGFTVDGHGYLGHAVSNGSPAFVVQEDHEGIWHAIVEAGGADVLVVPNTRRDLARLAAAYNGYPAREMGIVGITGTDGKTSLSHLVWHLLNRTGRKAGMISTAEYRLGDDLLGDTGRLTTPESTQVQSMLRQMADDGCRWAVIEATSHGLSRFIASTIASTTSSPSPTSAPTTSTFTALRTNTSPLRAASSRCSTMPSTKASRRPRWSTPTIRPPNTLPA